LFPILGSGVDMGDAIGGVLESDIPGAEEPASGAPPAGAPGARFIRSINLSCGTLKLFFQSS
jgi:hypothetical protein